MLFYTGVVAIGYMTEHHESFRPVLFYTGVVV